VEESQAKQLFIDLLGKEFKIYGLLVKLVNVHYGEVKNSNKTYYFIFEITNPNDVSYYSLPFEWEINEMLTDFSKYVDVKTKSEIYFDTNQGDLYFNQEKTKEIERSFKKVDTIKFTTGTPFIGYKRYELKIKSVGYKKGYNYENIWLENIIKPISATKNGEPCDIDEVILQYREEFLPSKETYWESEHLYQDLDQVLSSIPSIGNNDILLEYSTSLFRK
jgi:hypothetical protein